MKIYIVLYQRNKDTPPEWFESQSKSFLNEEDAKRYCSALNMSLIEGAKLLGGYFIGHLDEFVIKESDVI